MHIKVKATGKDYHVDRSAEIQIMLECGLVEEVPPESETKKRKIGTASWWVGTPLMGNTRAVYARCTECKASDIFTLGRGMTEADLANAKIEHCGKTERIPKDVLKQYFATGKGKTTKFLEKLLK